MATRRLPPRAETPSEDKELFFESINPAGSTSIIFIHGVLSCHLEWEHVTPYLSSDYHLILVDANGHSNSSSILPSLLPATTDRVADIIKRHAHDGKAHVVGLSMGGFVALELARCYPELVHSVFATGAHPFRGLYRWLSLRPTIIWVLLCLLHSMPDFLYWCMASSYGMAKHEELKAEMAKNRSLETVRDNYTSILDFDYEKVRDIHVRTAVIAGGLQDDVEATREMGPLLRQGGNNESQVFVVKGAVHAWSLQFPEVFALGIKAWVEGKDLPAEYEEL
ncbi:Alpha/Beta hydrolase protein [Dactylonectria macrodidyma]|uniref:Alpha/Beta hydrolase protein n=1 Tax=Dactylonectria macrodidyma TaxID=307937 RepID=A0A9P9FRJ6_9HYPO|nr:Alpha/Beta hydrolase protein [Dactylonectria macrodidyma]